MAGTLALISQDVSVGLLAAGILFAFHFFRGDIRPSRPRRSRPRRRR